MTDNANQSAGAGEQTQTETKPVKATKAAKPEVAVTDTESMPLIVSTCKIIGGLAKGEAVPAGVTFVPRSKAVFDSLPKAAWREPTEAEIAVYQMTNRSREAAAEDVVG